MKIFNATNSTLNLPLANKSRLIIRPFEASKQFLPTTELLQLYVSSYSRDDIAFIMESQAEISMGSSVSTLPGYIANSLEEAISRFRDRMKDNAPVNPTPEPKQRKMQQPKEAEVVASTSENVVEGKK